MNDGHAHAASLDPGHYYGAVDGRFATPRAVLSQVIHEEARALPEHEHSLAYFCMLVEGNYVESVAGREFEYRPFEVGFHPARMPHCDAVGARGAEFLCLEIHPSPLEAAGVRLRREPELLPGDVSLQLVRLYRAFRDATLCPLLLESAVWEVCGDAGEDRAVRERAMPMWLRRALEVVEEEFMHPLTVEALAAQAGVHPVHASREFRRRYGQTLGEYVNKVRIRASCAAIRAGRKPLAQVALEAGFADQPHFCRVFKASVGCTPSAFAAEARGRPARSRSQRTMSDATSEL